MAVAKQTTGTLASVTNGPGVVVTGPFALDLYGTFVGTVRLERRLDGTNWVPLFIQGVAHSRTTPASENINECFGSAEYRVACTAYTSGTVNWAITNL